MGTVSAPVCDHHDNARASGDRKRGEMAITVASVLQPAVTLIRFNFFDDTDDREPQIHLDPYFLPVVERYREPAPHEQGARNGKPRVAQREAGQDRFAELVGFDTLNSLVFAVEHSNAGLGEGTAGWFNHAELHAPGGREEWRDRCQQRANQNRPAAAWRRGRIAEKTTDMAVRVTPKLLPFAGRIVCDEMDMSFARCAEAFATLTL